MSLLTDSHEHEDVRLHSLTCEKTRDRTPSPSKLGPLCGPRRLTDCPHGTIKLLFWDLRVALLQSRSGRAKGCMME